MVEKKGTLMAASMAWMMVAHSDVTWESTPAALTVDRLVALSVGPRVASLAGRLELMALKKVEYLVGKMVAMMVD